MPVSCRNRYNVVMRSPAKLQRAPLAGLSYFNNLRSGIRPTNQGIVGSNPAGRARQSKGVASRSPFFVSSA